MPKIQLIIVNYNQEKEIGAFLSSVIEFWNQNDIVLVDDGSTDGSLDIAKSLNFICLTHSTNQGVGAAIRTGILHAKKNRYDHVLIMSSNGKMVPSEIPTVTASVLAGRADYVTGSRFLKGGRSPGLTTFRRMMIPVFSSLCAALLDRKFSDITCGFRCYKIDFLFNSNCDISQEWLSRYELEYYIHYMACRQKLRIEEVPVTIKYDHLAKNRQSKIRPFIDWWSMTRPLLYLRLGIRK